MRVIFNSLKRIPLDFIYRDTEFCEDFWLPEKMEPQHFSGNFLERSDSEKPCLTLSAQTMKSQGQSEHSPGLYDLEEADLDRGEFLISTMRGERIIRFTQSPHPGFLRDFTPISILVRDIESAHTESGTDAVFLQNVRSDTAHGSRRLRRLCAIECSLKVSIRPERPVIHENILFALPNQLFHILCSEYSVPPTRLGAHHGSRLWTLRTLAASSQPASSS